VTYEVAGRQYVAVAAGGNALFGFTQGDYVIAFALPE
jgi:glucose dehydrogenase